LVKGVCDYADADKDDTYHRYAAEVSAMYMLCFIREYVTSARIPERIPELNRGVSPAPDAGTVTITMPDAGTVTITIKLRTLIIAHFNDGELRDLCFDLGIDYENLPGQGKSDKARELVAYVQRYERTDELVALCRRLRPNVAW
jgi:hypothetical protein